MYIVWFKDLSKEDVELVGGKNANLGQMYRHLSNSGVLVPNGFAITTKAYEYYVKFNNLEEKIKKILEKTNIYNVLELQQAGEEIRNLIKKGEFPQDLEEEILKSFKELKKEYGEDFQVAVRSSASAEDLPSASFAGQQETYLNVTEKDLLEKVKFCFASLFTERAIFYRQEKGFDHFKVKLSVGVQKMVRSDLASSGVMFTLDTDTGLDKVIVINGVWGLGELIVQGRVIPDEWIVFKKGMEKGFRSVVSKRLGDKTKKIVYSQEGGTKEIQTSKEEKEKFSLTDDEVLELAKMGWIIEKHYGQAMDIEWAKDGIDGKLYIVQARAETVYSTKKKNIYEEYKLKEKGEILLKGIAIGSKIISGKVRVIKDVSKIDEFQPGEILVTEMTDPDWVPIMKIAKGIITDAGGRTSHCAIVSRELGIPAIVGTQKATEVLRTGDEVTIDCTGGITGYVYKGLLDYEIFKHDLEKLPEIKTKIYVNIGLPDEAWEKWYLPVKGVGLAREEFIISEEIKIHPNALIDYPNLPEEVKNKIDELTYSYDDKKLYFVDKLAEGIAKICTAYWPNEVIVRFSDFKTNEYRNLIGGDLYEPHEENPMIGWRGASRYYHPNFKKAFELEVLAMKKVREEIGLDNLTLMVPFCRTPEEGRKVIEIIEEIMGKRKEKGYKVYVMCEIPSNILQADEFLDIFDGMSIGSNDLTQLTLGIDRDNEILQGISDERNESVKKLIKEVIQKCNERGKYIGICGDAPSTFIDFAKFLVEAGIGSISLSPDAVIKTIYLLGV